MSIKSRVEKIEKSKEEKNRKTFFNARQEEIDEFRKSHPDYKIVHFNFNLNGNKNNTKEVENEN